MFGAILSVLGGKTTTYIIIGMILVGIYGGMYWRITSLESTIKDREITISEQRTEIEIEKSNAMVCSITLEDVQNNLNIIKKQNSELANTVEKKSALVKKYNNELYKIRDWKSKVGLTCEEQMEWLKQYALQY